VNGLVKRYVESRFGFNVGLRKWLTDIDDLLLRRACCRRQLTPILKRDRSADEVIYDHPLAPPPPRLLPAEAVHRPQQRENGKRSRSSFLIPVYAVLMSIAARLLLGVVTVK